MKTPLRAMLKEAMNASIQDQQKLQRCEKNMLKANKSFCRKAYKGIRKLDISSNARQPDDGNQDTATILLLKENELCII